MKNRVAMPAAVVTAALLLASCGSDPSTDDGAAPGRQLVASFYPLQYVTQRIAGDAAAVASLTKPGAEPHDLELTPQDVATIGDAELVIYLSGFQSAVDEAVEQEAGDSSFDVTEAADLDLTASTVEAGEEHADDEGEEHAYDEGVDPHFWLDPTRLANVADSIATRLGEVDPDNAQRFSANAADLRTDLEELDAEFSAGLADCAHTEIVTSHNAFGYLAERYGLEQVGITGLTPEDEPSPQDLAAATTFVEEHGVSTIYYETLVSPAIAEVVADETGAQTAVLDPLEGLNEQSAGADYLEVMRSNLASLQAGQSCT